MEWLTGRGLENRAFVIAPDGSLLGHQTKNQITPGGESEHYVPDGRRRLFRIDDLTFGIAICHEAWRYPETVRWAAVRGAQVVFQPQMTGSRRPGARAGPGGPGTLGGLLLREGDGVPGPGELDLLRQRELRPAGPDLGHQPARPPRAPAGARPLRPGAAARGRRRPGPGDALLRLALQPGLVPLRRPPLPRDARRGGGRGAGAR